MLSEGAQVGAARGHRELESVPEGDDAVLLALQPVKDYGVPRPLVDDPVERVRKIAREWNTDLFYGLTKRRYEPTISLQTALELCDT